jgi:hypothetical protein
MLTPACSRGVGKSITLSISLSDIFLLLAVSRFEFLS